MNPKTNPARPAEIPPDVEARYQAIQAEMQQLQLAPEALAGESREARYAREQRLRKLRREFDAMSRYPLARRQRSGATTVVLMAAVGVLLCMLSIGGGILVNTLLSRPPDISGTISGFMDAIKSQDYATAHTYLGVSALDVQAFTGAAQQADQALGNMTDYQLKEQLNGKSGDTTASATFQIMRAGNDGSDGYPAWTPHPYLVTIGLNYYSGAWVITNLGGMFTKPPDATPVPTPTPKGKA